MIEKNTGNTDKNIDNNGEIPVVILFGIEYIYDKKDNRFYVKKYYDKGVKRID